MTWIKLLLGVLGVNFHWRVMLFKLWVHWSCIHVVTVRNVFLFYHISLSDDFLLWGFHWRVLEDTRLIKLQVLIAVHVYMFKLLLSPDFIFKVLLLHLRKLLLKLLLLFRPHLLFLVFTSEINVCSKFTWLWCCEFAWLRMEMTLWLTSTMRILHWFRACHWWWLGSRSNYLS